MSPLSRNVAMPMSPPHSYPKEIVSDSPKNRMQQFDESFLANAILNTEKAKRDSQRSKLQFVF